MSRPYKQGVDYFPLDVHMDDKVKFIELKFGLEGYAIYIKLLQKIYSYGYWYKWGEDEKLLFANEINADQQLIESVINECLKRDLFHEKLYQQYGILTSRGIQKRYYEITKRRKEISVIPEYTLIDDINQVNVNINPTESEHDVSKNRVIATERESESETETESKKKRNYKSVFDYYLSLNLIKHRTYTKDMQKAIESAMDNNKYDEDYCKLLLDRHKQVIEITKQSNFPVKVRGLTEFFGQKVKDSKHLICSEYEEGGAKYEKYLKQQQPKMKPHRAKPQNKDKADPKKVEELKQKIARQWGD